MATETKIKRVRIDVAKNGYIIEWDQEIRTKRPGDEYANTEYNSQNSVVAKEANETDDQCLDRAMDEYKRVFKMSEEYLKKIESGY